MGTVNVNLSIMCACGQPENAPVHGPGGHQYKPIRGMDQVRDDQHSEASPRKGHNAIVEYRVITLAKPAAGADFLAKVPTPAQWRVQCMAAQLTTSAAIANRVPHLVITDGQGNTVYNFPPPGNQVQGTVGIYSAGTTVVSAQVDGATVWVLPFPMKLLQGWTIGSLTTAIDAGDQWANVVLHVKEWLYF